MEKNEKPDAAKINSAKLNVSLFLPALIEITDFSDFAWGKIDALFSSKPEERKIIAMGETIMAEATLFDTIIAAKKGSPKAIGMLHFLNKVFEELAGQLMPREKQMLCANIKDMLTAFDLRFYDFVGEIATLNNLMTTKAYRLERIESPLPNGKTIDFELYHIENASPLLVEIVNIHLDSDRVESNPTAIEKFLTHRLTKKVKDKKTKLEEDINIYLIPVLWGAWKDIEIYSNYFKLNSLKLKNVIEPLSLLTRSDDQGYYRHDFGSVSTLFKADC